MKRTLLLLLCLVATGRLTASAPDTRLAGRFERAWLAWNSGDYVPALDGFKAVLTAPGGEAYFERVALATGELYRVTELTTDGRQPRFSPDGRYLSYETASPAVTKIVEVADPARPVATLKGFGAVFSPTGDRIAYFRLESDGALMKARASLEEMQRLASPDRQKMTDLRRQFNRLVARQSEIVVRDLKDGRETKLADGGLLKSDLAWAGDGREVYFVGTADGDAKTNDIFATAESLDQPRAVTTAAGFKTSPMVARGGRYLLYTTAVATPFPAPGAPLVITRQGGPNPGNRQYTLLSFADGTTTPFAGTSAEFAADGSALVLVGHTGTEYSVQVLKPDTKATPLVIKKSQERIGSASMSPDGSRVAFEMPFAPGRDTEIFTMRSDGTGELRVTREIQPDRAPRFLTNSTLVAIKGESRHSRSFLYDLETLSGRRIFHNNTIRTIAPEYEWVPASDGRHLLIAAERDGDTISQERGVYLVDLGTKITTQDLVRRLDRSLAAERDLRRRGAAMFRPISAAVAAAVSKVSMTRLYEYQQALFGFDSKSIGHPGNEKAANYIAETFRTFGYVPDTQYFTTRDRAGADIRTANVLATLRGTANPELVYVLSSHYDSVERGPGADDNGSGMAVLLEAARVLSKTPMPATIVFAAFTGEEAGDLGSHEFVRQAVATKLRLMGVLNNDMIGWTNDYHLDNTIRYSNAGIRDLQHAASFLFSKMVTYDAKYYKGTDAAAFYDDFGDIVGGLGSYPVLGNPYYHEPGDLLETVNQQLVFEATRMNVASIMALASSPARLTGLQVKRTATGALDVTWTPAPEKAVVRYIVAVGPEDGPMAHRMSVTTAHARLPAPAGPRRVAVKAVNARGLESWDWAVTVVAGKGVTN